MSPTATATHTPVRPAAPSTVRTAPVRVPAAAPPATGWLVAGSHGGAGASTVAALLDQAAGPGVALEAAGARRAQLLERPRRLLLVARPTAYGTARAAAALAALPPSAAKPLLVLVADSPLPDPPAARYRIRALRARVAGVARLGYLPAARALDDARDLAATPGGRRAADLLHRDLAALCDPGDTPTGRRS